MYGRDNPSPKAVTAGTTSLGIRNAKFSLLSPSRYSCSIDLFSHQSGPINVKAIVIFVYIAPSAQSCHRKNTGDWFNDTRTGINTTTSSKNPNSSGIKPTRSITAMLALASCLKKVKENIIILSILTNTQFINCFYLMMFKQLKLTIAVHSRNLWETCAHP